MRAEGTFRHKACCILWSLLWVAGWVLPGPTASAATSGQEQAARIKEFLSDPNVVTCTLTTTAISALGLPDNRLPSFIRRLQQQKKENVKQGQITLAQRPFRVLLGERPEQEFYLYDVEKKFGPRWCGSWSLYSYHKIDDKFYEFALLPHQRPGPAQQRKPGLQHGGSGRPAVRPGFLERPRGRL